LSSGKLIPEEFDWLIIAADFDAILAACSLVIHFEGFIQLRTDSIFPVIVASLIPVHF
jgi:hypothetical protein